MHFVLEAVALRQCCGDLDITTARHAQRHGAQAAAAGDRDGAQQDAGVLTARELEHGIGMLVEQRRE